MYNNNQNQKFTGAGETFTPKTTSVLTTTQNKTFWEHVKSFSTGKGVLMFGAGILVGGVLAYGLNKLISAKKKEEDNENSQIDDEKE